MLLVAQLLAVCTLRLRPDMRYLEPTLIVAHLPQAGRAYGWVLFPAEHLRTNGVRVESIHDLLNKNRIAGRPPMFRWSLSDTWREEYGLGGGITFAFDPNFCSDILPMFAEGKDLFKFEKFVTCYTIKDTVRSAFSTWESNNRNIYFTDVSGICDENELWRNVSESDCSSTRCTTCPIAEVMITLFESHPTDHSGARVQPGVVSSAPLGTDLNRQAGGSFEHVKMQFGDNICWYIDASFCSMFHNAEIRGLPVVPLVGIVLGTSFLLATIGTLYAAWKMLKLFLYTMLSTWDTDADGMIEMWEIIGAGRAVISSLRNAIKCARSGGTSAHRVWLGTHAQTHASGMAPSKGRGAGKSRWTTPYLPCWT